MVEKKPQKIRFSSEELQVLKNTFADNNALLLSLRKVMLQADMPEQEEVRLKTVLKDNVIEVLKKFFLPVIDADAPIHQVVDLWMTIKLDDKDPEQALPHIQARDELIVYMGSRLKELEGEKVEGTMFKNMIPQEGDNAEIIYIKLTTRNTIIMHVEQQLAQIKLLAGMKDETPEETLERLHQDSAK